MTSSGSKSSPDPLGLEPAEMRRLAHRVVDLVLDHVEARADGPALTAGDPAALAAALGGPLPEAPGDPDAALDALVHVALHHMQHAGHPRFLTRIPSPAAWTGILGDWLGTGRTRSPPHGPAARAPRRSSSSSSSGCARGSACRRGRRACC